MVIVTNWDVPCPTCGAGINRRCNKNTGQAGIKFHAARIRAAARLRRTP